MSTVRLLHLADIHPQNSATFAGKTVIDPATGLNQALTDLDRSLDYVLEAAKGCHAALLTGDLFDTPRPHQNEVRVILRFVRRLAEIMPVEIVPGNHDMTQNPEDATALECLKGLYNVSVMEAPGRLDLALVNRPNGAEMVRFFFLPYPTRGRLLVGQAHLSPEELTATINRMLESVIQNLLMHRLSGGLNVFLGHGSVSTAKVGVQPRSIAQDILLPLDLLSQFDYAGLGHIHAWQQLSETVAYCGSLMRADFGEEHDVKGFNIVELERGRAPKIEHIPNPHARTYRTIDVMAIREDCCWDTTVVYRVKDELTPQDYDDVRDQIKAFVASVPFAQENIDLVTEARSRDAGMAECLGVEAALTRALAQKGVPEAEVPALLGLHRTLAGEEVGA